MPVVDFTDRDSLLSYGRAVLVERWVTTVTHNTQHTGVFSELVLRLLLFITVAASVVPIVYVVSIYIGNSPWPAVLIFTSITAAHPKIVIRATWFAHESRERR